LARPDGCTGYSASRSSASQSGHCFRTDTRALKARRADGAPSLLLSSRSSSPKSATRRRLLLWPSRHGLTPFMPLSLGPHLEYAGQHPSRDRGRQDCRQAPAQSHPVPRDRVKWRQSPDYHDFTISSVFSATNQPTTRSALLTPNWRGCEGTPRSGEQCARRALSLSSSGLHDVDTAQQFCGLKHDYERYSRQMPLQTNCATFEGRRQPRRRVRRMPKPNSRDRRSRGSRLVRLFRPQNCGAVAHALAGTGRVENDPKLSLTYNGFYLQRDRQPPTRSAPLTASWCGR